MCDDSNEDVTERAHESTAHVPLSRQMEMMRARKKYIVDYLSACHGLEQELVTINKLLAVR